MNTTTQRHVVVTGASGGIGAAIAGGAYAQTMANLPFGRMAHTEEIADAAWFLASPAAGHISGTTIDVDGGARWRVLSRRRRMPTHSRRWQAHDTAHNLQRQPSSPRRQTRGAVSSVFALLRSQR